MPFHSCLLCKDNNFKNPDLSFFKANKATVRHFNLDKNKDYFICEAHFDSKDLKCHGNTKRVINGRIPVHYQVI